MNTARNSVPPTLMEELREATHSTHVEFQDLPYFNALAAGCLPIESYVGHLRALSIIYGVLERSFDFSRDPAIASVWKDGIHKLPLLQEDLAFFEPRAVADIRESVEQALEISDTITLTATDNPAALLGILYVLEGSSQGAVTLAPQVQHAFLLSGEEGLTYLHCYDKSVGTHWARFQQSMNSLVLRVEERTRIIGAARDFFAAIKLMFGELYPFKPESITYLVTSINPEAGRHPIPTDPREIQAALRAASRCWERFPYFELRYGNRGRRFADSDGAWIATLVDLDQAQVNQQVNWLARVLATRGMPTILLQNKLELLFEELCAAVPEKKAGYEKLALAAAELHKMRSKHIDDASVRILAKDFDKAVSQLSERYKHAGELLVCAIADEVGGMKGASESMRAWMTEPSSFPPQWSSAVQATLTKSLDHARK